MGQTEDMARHHLTNRDADLQVRLLQSWKRERESGGKESMGEKREREEEGGGEEEKGRWGEKRDKK